LEFDFDGGINPVSAFFDQNASFLREPTRRERLEAEATTNDEGGQMSGHCPLRAATVEPLCGNP